MMNRRALEPNDPRRQRGISRRAAGSGWLVMMLPLLLGLSTMTFVGCEEKSGLEKLGDDMDEAVEEVRDEADDAMKAIKDEIDDHS